MGGIAILLHTVHGNEIKTIDDWPRPKRGDQWVPERSAMELARSWFRNSSPTPPDEITSLLNTIEQLEDYIIIEGTPEKVTRLPERGEGRNHDLWLRGNTNNGGFTICIEAKADEPFGNLTVSSYQKEARQKIEEGIKTKVPERIEKLLSLIGADENEWSEIRYQLLSAFTGTILQAYADNSAIAIFIVHEFHTSLTQNDNIEENELEFNRFAHVLFNDTFTPSVSGPIQVGGIDSYIAKIVTKTNY
ncbi:MAG: hypothetical protein K9L68_12395 [Spirochaetales bacterium]|nr:hypothetical protein [Spirochaetales bacterium]